MNTVDKITKEAKIIIDSAKDTMDSNLVSAVREDSFGLREDQVSKLINLVNLLLDQSFQKSIPYFQNSIKKHLT